MILIGAALFVAFGLFVGTATPSTGAGTAAPVVVDLADVQQGGHIGSQGEHPFRHPSGQAEFERQRFEGQFQAPTTGIQTVPPATASSLAPTAGTGFDGVNSAENFCGCYPPDGAVGVGPNNVVAAVNTAFKIWDKAGTVLVQSTALSSLFSKNAACLSNLSDPGVQYDAAAGGHYVIEALTFDSAYNSSICMAVSVTGDPTGSYYVYGFAVSPARDLLDFPQFAIGSDAVYLAGNQFQNGVTYSGARVYAYNKSQLFAGLATTFVYHDVGNDAAGFIADSLYPAKGVTVANTAYFLGADNNFSTGNNISLWKWSSPFGADAFTLQGGATVTTYAQPPKATEPGGTTDAGDVRNLGAGYYNGTIYGAHAIGCNPGGGTVPCVQWYQLGNVDATPSLVQQGIVGGTGQSRYYPNVSVDRSGDMLMAYAYASGTEYPGVRYTGRLASDPAGTVQAEGVLKAGEGLINGARYGDYAGEQLDPDGCTVWHLEEYAKAGALWGTWVGSMKFAGCGTADFALSVNPSSRSIAQGASTSYTVNVTPSGGFNGPVSLAVSGLPAGSGSSFSPNPATSTSTLTVTTSPSTPTGTFPLTITGTSGSLTHTASATLVVTSVTPVVTFAVAASGDDGNLSARGSAYPPVGTPIPNTDGNFVTAGRRFAFGSYWNLVGLMRFDTSALPDNATITSAKLRLYVTAKASFDSRNLVAEWYPSSSWPIDSSDYTVSSAGTALAAADMSSIAVGATNDFALTGLSSIATTGYTGLRLLVDGGQPSSDNYVQIAAWDHATLPEPQLVVTYTTP